MSYNIVAVAQRSYHGNKINPPRNVRFTIPFIHHYQFSLFGELLTYSMAHLAWFSPCTLACMHKKCKACRLSVGSSIKEWLYSSIPPYGSISASVFSKSSSEYMYWMWDHHNITYLSTFKNSIKASNWWPHNRVLFHTSVNCLIRIIIRSCNGRLCNFSEFTTCTSYMFHGYIWLALHPCSCFFATTMARAMHTKKSPPLSYVMYYVIMARLHFER